MSDNKLYDLTGQDRTLADYQNALDRNLKSGGGGGTFDDMEARVRELEKSHAVIAERLSSLDKRVDAGFDTISKKIDKLPTEWAMAKVVFYVVGALMAAAIFGPRLVSMFPT